MATISIIDSGYANLTEGGTQESLIANDGDAITLKGVNLTYSAGQSIDNTPEVGTEDNATLNPVSITNPIIKITGILDRTITADMNKIILFDTLRRSKGIKLLYYNSTADDISSGGADGWNNVISQLGEDNLDNQDSTPPNNTPRNTNQDGDTIVDVHTQSGGDLYNSGSPFPHLHVYIKSINITQGPTAQNLRFTLTCEVT